VRLGWVRSDEKEEPALAAVMERLRHEGEGVLLIFDNATDADAVKPYLPRGGTARVLVTSNAPAWRGVAEPVEIRVWPKETGAEYLLARTGREREREAAEELSEALGGLPLAHEQAAAYCERLEIPLAEYHRRFAATPVEMLDTERDAPAEYYDKLTVAKTFALAIEEAGKLHPAAEPLLVHAALLTAERSPLFLFAEAREKFGEPLSSGLAGDGLDEAVAALRIFALVDREMIVDERDPAVGTDTIRLHRLVREIAAARCVGETRGETRRVLLDGLASVYPEGVFVNPKTWPRARRLDAPAFGMVVADGELPTGTEMLASCLLNQLAASRLKALGAYSEARPLYERALTISERALGREHPDIVVSVNNLGELRQAQGDLAAARRLYERALTINEKSRGPEHPLTATSANNLGAVLRAQGDFTAARPLFERTLEIRQKILGVEHPDTATSMNNLAGLQWDEGNLDHARPLLEGALAIREKVLGPEHPDTAGSLNNLAGVLREQRELEIAQQRADRALAIREKILGADHPATAQCHNTLALILLDKGNCAAAQRHFQRALAIQEKTLGCEHLDLAATLNNLGCLLRASGDLRQAKLLLRRALAIREKTLGVEHPDTATSLNSLARSHQDEGDLDRARSLLERALNIWEKRFGLEHHYTGMGLNNLAGVLQDQSNFAAARPLFERALAIYERVFGPDHHDTLTVRNNLAALTE
jgi:tetratricopeptide (TPR) repeat protein